MLKFCGTLIAFALVSGVGNAQTPKTTPLPSDAIVVTYHMTEVRQTTTYGKHECWESISIANRTRYHLRGFKAAFGKYHYIDGTDLPANNTRDGVAFRDVTSSAPTEVSCVAIAKELAAEMKVGVRIGDCTLDGIAEGDCQAKIQVRNDYDLEKLAKADADAKAKDEARAIKLRSENFKTGQVVPVPKPQHEVSCDLYDGSGFLGPQLHAYATMEMNTGETIGLLLAGAEVAIDQVHLDEQGVADAYRIEYTGLEQVAAHWQRRKMFGVSGWVPRMHLTERLAEACDKWNFH